ncbi:zinc-finger-containing protein [Extibacter muris]|uniref:Uncharacterized protein n=1 Tax=Extibacter muris TaxID=1796622 RepID=A0A4R4FGH9_9FIRM|nr:zinc-finger-containing protein [Extibacter muris]MCU0080203.1 DUF3268 family zinc-finger domain-containing protein [Extibacter muris]TDA22568.1 hypothetical protein E1963_03865 [Extibacter muris]
MKPSDFQKTIQCQFECKLKRVVKGIVKNYQKELKRRMSKQDAYQWLADLICAPLSEAHIGYLGEYYCKQVIEESRASLSGGYVFLRGSFPDRLHWAL